MDEYIKDVSNSLDFNINGLTKVNNNLFLTKKEIEILEKYNINYKVCSDFKMLMYLIDDYLNDSYDTLDDLENISIDISERNYYMNTNK